MIVGMSVSMKVYLGCIVMRASVIMSAVVGKWSNVTSMTSTVAVVPRVASVLESISIARYMIVPVFRHLYGENDNSNGQMRSQKR